MKRKVEKIMTGSNKKNMGKILSFLCAARSFIDDTTAEKIRTCRDKQVATEAEIPMTSQKGHWGL
jgi:hypothetical protein